ncbi:uncharacterized protein LOC143905453 [Temnothorax americanus]|uniref:uncharacterized protein LOC143905453 n=1 Tax=Temnothorax americanus TaxID=1964332 RepID=UPI00406991C5
MDKLNQLKGICEMLQIQTAALTREVDDMYDVVKQLQARIRNISEKMPPCLQLTVRVDEDAVMLERTTIIISLAKKCRNQIRVFVSRIRGMYRDVARLNATGEVVADRSQSHDGDEPNIQEREVVNIDEDEDVPENWPSQM